MNERKGKRMRCAIDFDENKPLVDQEIRAWGEMQSISEEPCYKESDIKKEKDREFFFGYKAALDDACNVLEQFVEFGDLDEATSEEIQCYLSGELCMQLFSILDNEYCEEDDDK